MNLSYFETLFPKGKIRLFNRRISDHSVKRIFLFENIDTQKPRELAAKNDVCQ